MTHLVVDEGDSRKYRIEIPNMLDESDLDPFEFRLYAHLKRRAGDSGKCFEGTRKVAETCKMSVGKVSEAKKSLAARGLIRVIEGDPKTSTPDTIFITDVWRENLTHIQKKYPNATPVHQMNTPVHETPLPCSPDEHPCSPGEHKKEPIEERTKTKKGGSTRARAQGEIPEWLDASVWSLWYKHRKEIRHSLTPTQSALQIELLEKFRARGMPPENVIKQSIAHGWQGLFELREERSNEDGKRRNSSRGNSSGANDAASKPPRADQTPNREWTVKNRL